MRYLLLSAALASATFAARADLVQWDLDPARSFVAVTGDMMYGGTILAPLLPQGGGQISTSFSGTMQTEIGGNGAQTFQFLGGVLTASNSGNFYPGPLGEDASEPAVTGVFVDPGSALGIVYGALRNLQTYAQRDESPLVDQGGGLYTTDSDVQIFVKYDVAFRGVGGLAGAVLGNGYRFESDQFYYGGLNVASGPATVQQFGAYAELTLPIIWTFEGEVYPATPELGIEQITANFTLTGQLVASTAVPEAGGLTMISCGLVVFAAVVWRRRQRMPAKTLS